MLNNNLTKLISSALPKKLKRVNLLNNIRDWHIDKTTDVYLLSFPKCGRTWLRLMLGKVLQRHFKLPEDINILEISNFSHIDKRIPRITISHDDKPHLKESKDLDVAKMKYRNKKVILLIRDPRDVIVSSYFQATRRETRYNGDLTSYLRHEVGSLDTLLNWYNIWAKNRNIPSDILIIQYENLHKDAKKELKKVIHFLKLLNIDETVIDEAVEYACFDNMHKMEAKKIFQSTRLTPGQYNDPESYKTRRGKVGGYIDYLDQTDIDFLNKKIKENLLDFYDFYKRG